MGHKFNPDHAGRLDSRLRRLLVSRRGILDDINPADGDIWADIGAGTGYFAMPLARRVRKVYALDISDRMLESLRETATKKGITNIETARSQEIALPLADASLDGALMAFVAHELDEPAQTFLEIARVLKSGARLIVVEFAKVRGGFGPPLHERLSPEQVDDWAAAAGLRKGASWKWTRSVVGWEYVKA